MEHVPLLRVVADGERAPEPTTEDLLLGEIAGHMAELAKISAEISRLAGTWQAWSLHRRAQIRSAG